MIVYHATNRINGKCYVGITKNSLSTRVAQHLRGCGVFHCALLKYGIQSFDISIIDEAEDWKTLCEKEQFWIRKLQTRVPKGYNLTDGGEGIINYHHSVEARKKISVAQTGRPLTAAHKAKLSAVAMGKAGTRKGAKLSVETKRKMSKAAEGRTCKPFTAEHRANLSIAIKGRKVTPEARKNMSAAQAGRVCKPFTPEHRAKISAANKGRKHSTETKIKMSAARRGNSNSAHKGVKLSAEARTNIAAGIAAGIAAAKQRRSEQQAWVN